MRALTVLGGDLVYLGAAAGSTASARRWSWPSASATSSAWTGSYVNLSDALMMLGQLRTSARLAQDGLDAMRRYGIDNPLLAANRIEALVALGDWDEAERSSADALRGIGSSFPYPLLSSRARASRSAAACSTPRAATSKRLARRCPTIACSSATTPAPQSWRSRSAAGRTWRRSWRPVCDGRRGQRRRSSACSSVRRAYAGRRTWRPSHARAGTQRRCASDRSARGALLESAREAAAAAEPVTPNASGWLALAEAEHLRASGHARPDAWAAAASTWDRLDRPPLAAYCRWREAEALVAAGASRATAGEPLRAAHAVATGLGAAPLIRELELLAQRARLDLAPAPIDGDVGGRGVAESLGLTAREAEVLALVARGYTNREIAATLVISVKTASLHVSHILAKLGAPNRREAAAIAHRLGPGAGG